VLGKAPSELDMDQLLTDTIPAHVAAFWAIHVIFLGPAAAAFTSDSHRSSAKNAIEAGPTETTSGITSTVQIRLAAFWAIHVILLGAAAMAFTSDSPRSSTKNAIVEGHNFTPLILSSSFIVLTLTLNPNHEVQYNLAEKMR